MTDKRQWYGLAAVVCLLVLAAGYMLMVRPQHSKAADVKTQTQSVQSQITTLESQLAQLKQESKGVVQQQALLAQFARQLPTTPQEPDLLRSLQSAATAAHVDMTSLAPGNPTALSVPATSGSTTAAGSAASATASTIAQIPVTMSVDGTYFEMEQFISSLEGLQRSMLVDSFSLTYGAGSTSSTAGAATSSTGTAADTISASITARIFMSTGTAPAGSATTAATTGAGTGAAAS